MCGTAKRVIVSKNDVSQDDSKLALQTTSTQLCSCASACFLPGLFEQDWGVTHLS